MPACPSCAHTEDCQDQLVASEMTAHSWAVLTGSCWRTSERINSSMKLAAF